MTNKVFYTLIVGVIVIGLGFLVLSGGGSDPAGNTDEASNKSSSTFAVSDDDRFLNQPENSKAVLIEYSDFQCPACAAVSPLIREVKNEFSEELTVIFRHYPLISIHPNAMAAHRIAEAAHNQNRFAEVHDLLFEQNQAWANASNPSDAIYSLIEGQVDLDMDQLQEDAASSESMQAIQRQIATGGDLGIEGTPTFFLNGKPLVLTSAEQLRTEVQKVIDEVEIGSQNE